MLWICLDTALQRRSERDLPCIYVILIFAYALVVGGTSESVTYLRQHVNPRLVTEYVEPFAEELARREKRGRSSVNEQMERQAFPSICEQSQPPLPEDYFLQGQSWVGNLLPINHLASTPSYGRFDEKVIFDWTRKRRVLWLAQHVVPAISSQGRGRKRKRSDEDGAGTKRSGR